MSDFSTVIGGNTCEDAGADTANSVPTTITAAGSNNTKGSWTELVASSSYDSEAMLIHFGGFAGIVTTARADYLIDIGVGAASSEQVILSNLLSSNPAQYPDTILVPLSVPAGSRVAARCQCSAASGVVGVSIKLLGNTLFASPGLQRITPYGADTSDSGGVNIDPGATADTKGSWTEVTSSTTHDIKALGITTGQQRNTTRSVADFLFDIGVGAASSEQTYLENIPMVGTAAEKVHPKQFPFIPMQIPSGSRIAVRAQCSITDATDRRFDIVLYGAD